MQAEISMIHYLLDEIANEQIYNKGYKEEYERAREMANKSSDRSFPDQFMDFKQFPREPRKSVIEDNKKLIRRLVLKIKSEV